MKTAETKRKKHPSRNSKYKKASKTVRIWFWFFIVFDVSLIAGFGTMIWEANQMGRLLNRVQQVERLEQADQGLVAVTGELHSDTQEKAAGKLKGSYAILQKYQFNWGCSRSNCDYRWNESNQEAQLSRTFRVGETWVSTEHVILYRGWLPLHENTVELGALGQIYDGGSARPLLIHETERSAFGYKVIQEGEEITIVGRLNNHVLEPMKIPGYKEERKGVKAILVGASLDDMKSLEGERVRNYWIFLALFTVIFGPVTWLLYRSNRS